MLNHSEGAWAATSELAVQKRCGETKAIHMGGVSGQSNKVDMKATNGLSGHSVQQVL